MAVTTSDIRKGMIIKFKENLFEIVEFLHVKPGKGGAFVRTKLRNIKTGQVLENTFRSGEKINPIRVEVKKMEYLYFDGDFYMFMNMDTYDQIQLTSEIIGDNKYYLTENMELKIRFDASSSNEVLGMELPITVEQLIENCEPNVKGNTVSGSGKNATTQTGLNITVPFFIEINDKIKIDTRTGEYLERV